MAGRKALEARPVEPVPPEHAPPAVPRQQVSPLFVLLEAMRTKWAMRDLDGAAALAKAVAPYVHPRVPAAGPIEDLSEVSDAQLAALASYLRANAEGEDQGEPA